MNREMAPRRRRHPRHLLRDLRGGFVLRPGAIAVGLAMLAIGLAEVEQRLTAVKAWSDALDRLFPPEPDAARVVLGTIAGSMMTVVSVVYSILLLSLTFASAQFSPRVLVTFVEDKVSQNTLGIFIGTFLYCLLTLASVRTVPRPFVPSVAVIVAMALAVACLACLLYFIHHIALSIQASHIVHRLAHETKRVLEQVFPRPLGSIAAAEPVPMAEAGTPIFVKNSGYIRTIHEARLRAIAIEHGVCLQVERPIGQFVMSATPLLTVVPGALASHQVRAECLRSFEIGPTRTMDQDVEFGILQIVDIALKAISPAVNDPTTATTCLDHLGSILALAASREPAPDALVEADGRVVVRLRRTTFPRLLEVAFSQIRHYGKADVAVPLRLMRILGELAGVTRPGPDAAAVRDQARRLSNACAQGLPEDERAELLERYSQVERTTSAT